MTPAAADNLLRQAVLGMILGPLPFEIAVSWDNRAPAAWRVSTLPTIMTTLVLRADRPRAVRVLTQLAHLGLRKLDIDPSNGGADRLLAQIEEWNAMGPAPNPDTVEVVYQSARGNAMIEAVCRLAELTQSARTPSHDYADVAKIVGAVHVVFRGNRSPTTTLVRIVRKLAPHPPTLAELTR